MTTATVTAALVLVRDPATALNVICERFNCSPDYAAGLIDAVEGNSYFAAGVIEWAEADERVRGEYLDGFAAGEALLNDERYGEGWREAHTAAQVEQWIQTAAEPACDPADIPF
jgi:hypothetical protein